MADALRLLIAVAFLYGVWRFLGFLAREHNTTRYGLLRFVALLSWLTRR